MRIKMLLVIALIIVVNTSYSQTVSKADFDKAVDYMNCKSIELSLKKSPTKNVTAQFKSTCDCEQVPNNLQIKSSIPTSESKTIALSSEINSVKEKEYKPNNNIEEVIEVLLTKVFADNNVYPTLYSFSNRRINDTSFSAFKTDLKERITILCSKQTTTDPKTKSPGTTALVKDTQHNDDFTPEKNTNEDNSSFFTFRIDVISVLFTLIVLLILLKHIYFSNGNGKEKISESIRGYVKQKIYEAQIDARSDLGSGSASNGSAIRKLKNEVEELKSLIKKLALQVEASKVPFEVIQPKYDVPSFNEAKQSEIKANSEVLYLSTPNNDGSFNATSAQSTYREGASIYKFTKISGTKAKFQIDEREASVKLALQYPDKNIDPVCDAQNAFNPKAKRIVTLLDGAGEVDLVGDRWMLNRKAKIRYEN